MNRDRIRNQVKHFVGERRYPHILGTEQECLRLASIFELDGEQTEKLATAALLHDITKHFSRQEHLDYMENRGGSIPSSFLASEKTLHALTGAYMAKELYPEETDDTVFSAIRYHTTGKAGMTLTEKLMYLADYIEPNRTFEDCVKLRNYFNEQLFKRKDKQNVLRDTLLLSFDMTIRELLKGQIPIHPDTVAAWNDLLAEGSNGQ